MNGLIIISGASGVGKTSVANELARRLPGYRVLSQDRYCKDRSHLLRKFRFFDLNHELPEIVDHDSAYQGIAAILNGNDHQVPRYIHGELRSITGGVVPGGPLIYEGLHSLYDRRLDGLSTYRVFIDCSIETMLERRLRRDMGSRAVVSEVGYAEYGVPARRYAEQVVIPAFNQYVKPLRKYADLCVDGHQGIVEIAEFIGNAYRERNVEPALESQA